MFIIHPSIFDILYTKYNTSFLVRLVCSVTPEGVGSFEGVLFPIFQIILQQDILGMNEEDFSVIVYFQF